MENKGLIRAFIWSQQIKHKKKSIKENYLFLLYLWGKNGIDDTIKHIIPSDYGTDLELILFEFYIKPFSDMQSCFKKMGNYSPKGRSVGIRTIINDKNFFSRTKAERFEFLINVVLDGVERLKKKKKLDTDFDKLLDDLKKSFDDWWTNHDIDQEFIEPENHTEKDSIITNLLSFLRKITTWKKSKKTT